MMSDVTEQELAELSERSKDDRAIIVGSEVRRLIAALREARAKNDRLLKISRELEEEAESKDEYIGELQTKLAAIRAVADTQKQDDELWQVGAYYSEAMRRAVLDLHGVILSPGTA